MHEHVDIKHSVVQDVVMDLEIVNSWLTSSFLGPYDEIFVQDAYKPFVIRFVLYDYKCLRFRLIYSIKMNISPLCYLDDVPWWHDYVLKFLIMWWLRLSRQTHVSLLTITKTLQQEQPSSTRAILTLLQSL